MNRLLNTFLFLSCLPWLGLAQSTSPEKPYVEQWDAYLAQYANGPGAITLDMGLVNIAPVKELPYLIVAGIPVEECDRNGFPEKYAFEKLYEIEDMLGAALAETHDNKSVATFTNNCRRSVYFYVTDTIDVRKKLMKAVQAEYKGLRLHVAISFDPKWETYLNYLYPSEMILESMANARVLEGLMKAGDNLQKTRPLDHWFYFRSENDRKHFLEWAEKAEFSLKSKGEKPEGNYTYELVISRTDGLQAETIDALTLKLKKKAREFGGEYDGWETVVVKE